MKNLQVYLKEDLKQQFSLFYGYGLSRKPFYQNTFYQNTYNFWRYYSLRSDILQKLRFNHLSIIKLENRWGMEYSQKDFNNSEPVYVVVNQSDYQFVLLSKNMQNLNSQINNLQSNNKNLSDQIDNQNNQINSLTNQLNEEKQNRKNEKKIFDDFKKSFEEEKKSIEKKNIEKSKKYITNLIINKYLKKFEIEEEKENKFKTSLTEFMIKFTEEYMQYSQQFLQQFKMNSQKIVKEYNINKDNLFINHINFIVIGQAGVGKSCFINESLMLPENKRAREGKGKSVTDKSILYCSEKLKMIRMWDTQGLDYKTTQEFILNEVKRLVDDGLKKGPDHFINIILYCTTGDRFQDEDGQLIQEIMKIYPFDNLPVIITQLKAYFKKEAEEMEKIIRKILENYLDHNIVKKIEIRSIVSREMRDENKVYKARGIPELLRLSFDIMSRALTSATFKKLTQDIENLCKFYVDQKIEFIQKIFKYEMEILEVAKTKFIDDMEEEQQYFEMNEKKRKQKKIYQNKIYIVK